MLLLAVSGSLRAVSKNTAILEAARLLAPPHVEIHLYPGLDRLPHFNPDLDTADGRGGPEAVADWRTRVARADGLLISTPEYAHGLPGPFKNALDWLVSSVDFPGSRWPRSQRIRRWQVRCARRWRRSQKRSRTRAENHAMMPSGLCREG